MLNHDPRTVKMRNVFSGIRTKFLRTGTKGLHYESMNTLTTNAHEFSLPVHLAPNKEATGRAFWTEKEIARLPFNRALQLELIILGSLRLQVAFF